MILFYQGNDTAKINKIIEKKIAEIGASEIYNFLEEKEINFLADYLYDEDIFGNQRAIVCKYCLENPNSMDFIVERAENFKTAKNIFIFVEKKVKDPSKIKKVVNEFVEANIKEVAGANKTFLFATLIEKKDRKGAWFCLQDLKEEYSIEQVLGIVKWKILTMLANFKFRNTYEKEKLISMLKDVVFMFNEIHQNVAVDGYDELEKWVLKYI